MYDAKKDGFSDEKQLRYECIGDRCYFAPCNQYNLLNLKSCYVPIENITVLSEGDSNIESGLF